MGKEGIRYAAKVSLDKPAAEQDCLHVSTFTLYDFLAESRHVLSFHWHIAR
jgi:hypothetical protein